MTPRPRSTFGRIIGALTAVAISATTAFASPHDALERGRICWFALDMDCAERELMAAHADRDALSVADRGALLALLAELRLAAEQSDLARPHLVELLDLEPTFAPKWPPAWLATLDEARRLAKDRLPPTITAALPQTAPIDTPLTITAHVVDPSGVARVEVAVSDRRFAMSTTDGERWSTTLPRELVKTGLTLQVLAWDRHQNGPTAFPGAPHQVTVTAEPAPALTSRWWFWAAIAGATGLAIALGFALAPSDDTPATSGDLGITLELP